ncbi:hypothetical protein BV372_08020 [Nostoc sp. T09]|uniref:hypothetical protein n=1 Tax=Nostoc sp. T09 TaxID=1932621 RepID=UPI000A36351F|nr:hypothetical protein [Nostoc sp. T09]OUL36355.1 hypothetical protein BV372_08020 [Nostoc sp. T09]
MINNISVAESNNRFNNCSNDEKTLVANAKAEVLDQNTDRRYAAFINNSVVDITLILGSTEKGAINKGIVLKPRGSYEINANNLYLGKVSAVSAFPCKLTFVECI